MPTCIYRYRFTYIQLVVLLLGADLVVQHVKLLCIPAIIVVIINSSHPHAHNIIMFNFFRLQILANYTPIVQQLLREFLCDVLSILSADMHV